MTIKPGDIRIEDSAQARTPEEVYMEVFLGLSSSLLSHAQKLGQERARLPKASQDFEANPPGVDWIAGNYLKVETRLEELSRLVRDLLNKQGR
jgi:hypothetical protein